MKAKEATIFLDISREEESDRMLELTDVEIKHDSRVVYGNSGDRLVMVPFEKIEQMWISRAKKKE